MLNPYKGESLNILRKRINHLFAIASECHQVSEDPKLSEQDRLTAMILADQYIRKAKSMETRYFWYMIH